jgi:hypothetical protein
VTDERFRWTLRVTTARPNQARVFARKHQFEVGPPISYDRDERSITALEYAIGALGAEIVSGLTGLAKRRRVEIDAAEALLNAELDDPMAQLGAVGATGHPGLHRLEIKVYVSSFEDPEAVRRVFEEAIGRSTLLHTLRRAVTVELALQIA